MLISLLDFLSSSSMKTPFICASIFGIKESFAMYFFTGSFAPSVILAFIFSLNVWFSCLSSSMIASLFFIFSLSVWFSCFSSSMIASLFFIFSLSIWFSCFSSSMIASLFFFLYIYNNMLHYTNLYKLS